MCVFVLKDDLSCTEHEKRKSRRTHKACRESTVLCVPSSMKDLTIWKALSHNVSMWYLCSGIACSSLVKENIIGNLIFLTLNVFGSFLFVVPYECLNDGCEAGAVNRDTVLFSVLIVKKDILGVI